MNSPNWVAIIVFVLLFALVTVMGFLAARWRAGNLDQLHEWGLAGRRFGTVVTWFLLGGDLYTAYTFVAVPALVYGSGAIGFFALPYTIITYPFVFVVMPRLWSVARKYHLITAADFVRARHDSGLLALAVALTGILATMPYIALQLVGIQVVIAAMGITGQGIMADLPLIIAFLILAAYTYTSGLRAPAMIALVKDLLIYITIIVAVLIIPAQIATHAGDSGLLAGYKDIFAAAQKQLGAKIITPANGPTGYLAFATLAFGSALALFMYPHSVTGVLSSKSRTAIKRNMALLPAYSFALGLIALLGYMAIAVGVNKADALAGPGVKQYGAQFAVPGLFLHAFQGAPWFLGFAFAAVAIGALVPAAIMSIAASNLFTRNIYREYFRKGASDAEEARTAKLVSLVVKLGALAFIIFLPTQYAINLQLLGGIWIIQTLPSIVLGLYTRWFHRYALLIGWAVGMVIGTGMAYIQSNAVNPHFASSTYALHLFGQVFFGYAAVYSLIANLVIAGGLTLLFSVLKIGKGQDQMAAADFEAEVPAAIAVG
jgi:SSS family solute:Na+ symporter